MLAKQLLKEFIYECEIRKLTWKTIKGYRNNNLYLLNYIEREFGIVNVEEIETSHIKAFLMLQQKNNRKVTYTNGLIKVFRAFYKYLKEEGYISINPMLKIKWGRQKRPVIKTFTPEEVSRMMKVFRGFDYLNIRNMAIMGMLFDTGIRCYELCCLKNVGIKDTCIIIWGKGGKERILGKSPYLDKLLMRYEQAKKAYFQDKGSIPDNFFLSRNGKPLTNEAVARIVSLAGKEAGVSKDIRCSPHTCRHWFAQAQLKNGLDVYSLSRLLGHSNIKITQVYLDSMEDANIVQNSIKTSPLMNL
jgi:Site-specific recombinase XerD